jgi:photoactive yellow protein
MEPNTATTAQPFLSATELRTFERLSPRDLDKLPFGAIQLDAEGKILSFNAHEAQLTGRDPERVIGRNFFTEVAPCTNVQQFHGRFVAGVAAKQLHESFPYRFDFQMAPRDVTVTLFYSKITGTGWVFVRERT